MPWWSRLAQLHLSLWGPSQGLSPVTPPPDGPPSPPLLLPLLPGNTKEDCANSAFLENLNKKGYEVIFFTDVLDE